MFHVEHMKGGDENVKIITIIVLLINMIYIIYLDNKNK